MDRIKVLVVDDHAQVRAGIRSFLDACDDIRVVAEAGDGGRALELVEEHGPDVVVLDISLPTLDGLEVTRRIGESHPGVRVLILSMRDDAEYVRRAQAAGALGYVLKYEFIVDLDRAVRQVAHGKEYLSPSVARRLVMEEGRVGQAGDANDADSSD